MTGQVKARTLALVVKAGERVVRRLPVTRERLTLGRRPYNDVVLDDLTVSGEHALLSFGREGILVRDLNSRNGTLVDGRAVSECVVEPGARVEIGIYRVGIEESDDELVEPAPIPVLPQAETPQGGSPPPGLVGRSPEPVDVAELPVAPSAPSAPSAQEAGLEYLTGAYAGIRQPLERAITRVSDGGTQVAVISKRKSGFFLTHLEGPGTPRVNGESVGHSGRRLADGDQIELGTAFIRFVSRG